MASLVAAILGSQQERPPVIPLHIFTDLERDSGLDPLKPQISGALRDVGIMRAGTSSGRAVVMVVVLVALGVALFGPRKWKQRVGGERLIWIAGLVFPVVVLTGLLIYGLTTTARVARNPPGSDVSA